MGKKKYSWFPAKDSDWGTWERLCPPNEYRIVSTQRLPDCIPDGLKSKADMALVFSKETAASTVYCVANILRIDEVDSAIDQEPFAVAFYGPQLTSYPHGCLRHHGKWEGRTTRPPDDFWDCVHASNIHAHYPLDALPEKPEGSIDELKGSSHERALTVLKVALDDDYSRHEDEGD